VYVAAMLSVKVTPYFI